MNTRWPLNHTCEPVSIFCYSKLPSDNYPIISHFNYFVHDKITEFPYRKEKCVDAREISEDDYNNEILEHDYNCNISDHSYYYSRRSDNISVPRVHHLHPEAVSSFTNLSPGMDIRVCWWIRHGPVCQEERETSLQRELYGTLQERERFPLQVRICEKLWGNYQRAALVNKLTRLIRNYLEINLLLVIQ